jgi:hypothetical protein
VRPPLRVTMSASSTSSATMSSSVPLQPSVRPGRGVLPRRAVLLPVLPLPPMTSVWLPVNSRVFGCLRVDVLGEALPPFKGFTALFVS